MNGKNGRLYIDNVTVGTFRLSDYQWTSSATCTSFEHK